MAKKAKLLQGGDGTAVPTGMVFNIIDSTLGNKAYSSTNNYKYAGVSLTLPIGTYLVTATLDAASTTVGNSVGCILSTTNTDDQADAVSGTTLRVNLPSITTLATSSVSRGAFILTVAAAATYYVKTYVEDAATLTVYAQYTALRLY